MCGVLCGHITPRNIVFAPEGKRFSGSCGSLGTVTRLDTASGQARAVITGFAQPQRRLEFGADVFGDPRSDRNPGPLWMKPGS